jgi:hypothetical protein
VFKERRMGHLKLTGKKRYSYRISDGKPEKIILVCLKNRWEKNIKIYLKNKKSR